MFFLLSKTLDVLLEPLLWAVAMALSGAVLLARGKKRPGLALSLAAPALLLVFAWGPVARRLTHSMEAGAPDTFKPEATYDVVVLLGGAVDHAGSTPTRPSYNEGVERLLTTFDLLRTGRARFAVVSGGSAYPGGPTEAKVLTDQLVAWGIDPARLILEERAENTRQNATEVAALVKQRGFSSVLIVTSAFHMRRALGCFEAVNLPVDTLPVDFHMRDPARWPDLLPRAAYLDASSRAIREAAGRAVYRVAGYAK